MSSVEIAFENIDPETGEGEILTTPTENAFISLDQECEVGAICLVASTSENEINQIFLCVLDEDFGIGNFEINTVGIRVRTSDNEEIEFAFFGQIQVGDENYSCFSPINLENPDMDIFMDDSYFGVEDPQESINRKWGRLAKDSTSEIRFIGSRRERNFKVNPKSTISHPERIFGEHLNALKRNIKIPFEL